MYQRIRRHVSEKSNLENGVSVVCFTVFPYSLCKMFHMEANHPRKEFGLWRGGVKWKLGLEDLFSYFANHVTIFSQKDRES